jgi:hypothetical protein
VICCGAPPAVCVKCSACPLRRMHLAGRRRQSSKQGTGAASAPPAPAPVEVRITGPAGAGALRALAGAGRCHFAGHV